MTSKLVVNTIESDTGISSVSFASSISMSSTSKFFFGAAGIDIGADTNINRPAAGVLGFNINSSEKVRIDSSGRLLIGTTTEGNESADELTVASSGNTGITIRSGASSNASIFFTDATSGADEYRGFIQYVQSNDDLKFGTATSEKLRITTDGNILIGTTVDSNNKVTLYGSNASVVMQNVNTGNGASQGFYIGNGNGTLAYVWNYENDEIRFATNNVGRLIIQADGDVSFSNSSTGSAQIKNVSGNQSDVDNGGFPQYAFVGNEGTGMRRVSSNVLAFDSTGAERLRINSLGNVSIGGIEPVPTSTSYNTASLHIHQQTNNTTSGAQVHLTTANKGSGSAAGTQLSQYNGSLYINNQDDQFMYFYNNDNNGHRMAIRNDGTVCFGRQTSNTLYSSGGGSTWYDQKDSWQMAQSGDLGWSCWYINKIGGSDNRLIQFNSSGSAIGYINRSGSNVVYSTSSDYRLKKDDVEISDGIERVKKLRPIKFKWKETNEESEGFFAHEAQEICPYAVSGHKDEVATTDHGDRKKGDMIIQAVDYGEFTPLLSAAMKELITKVETLEAEVAALKGS